MHGDNYTVVGPYILTDSLWIRPTDALNSNFIGITTLHVSGSLSAHHQEFLAVHRIWFILCSCDDRLLPGAGWNCSSILLLVANWSSVHLLVLFTRTIRPLLPLGLHIPRAHLHHTVHLPVSVRQGNPKQGDWWAKFWKETGQTALILRWQQSNYLYQNTTLTLEWLLRNYFTAEPQKSWVMTSASFRALSVAIAIALKNELYDACLESGFEESYSHKLQCYALVS